MDPDPLATINLQIVSFVLQLARNCKFILPLCSRNFENVKLRLDFVMISKPLRFYVKLTFVNSNSEKCHLAILKVLNLVVDKFEQFFMSKMYQNSKFKVSKIVKKAISEIQRCQK